MFPCSQLHFAQLQSLVPNTKVYAKFPSPLKPLEETRSVVLHTNSSNKTTFYSIKKKTEPQKSSHLIAFTFFGFYPLNVESNRSWCWPWLSSTLGEVQLQLFQQMWPVFGFVYLAGWKWSSTWQNRSDVHVVTSFFFLVKSPIKNW